MKITVKLTQVREAHVEIEANDMQEALAKAHDLYTVQGRELPEMEDVGPLRISIDSSHIKAPEPKQYTGDLCKEEVEEYLTKNGYPHPSQDAINDFLDGGERQPFFTEAVRNAYDLCDVDRWFHLMDVLDAPISFRAAIFVDSALWEEEYETMELNTVNDLLEPPEGILKQRLEDLLADVSANGKISDPEVSITLPDLHTLAKALKLNIPKTLADKAVAAELKPPLSSLINDASSRAGSIPSQSQPEREI